MNKYIQYHLASNLYNEKIVFFLSSLLLSDLLDGISGYFPKSVIFLSFIAYIYLSFYSDKVCNWDIFLYIDSLA